jgi:hypothetical protein
MQIRTHQPHFQYSPNSLLPLRPHTVHRALSATWLTVVSGHNRFSTVMTALAEQADVMLVYEVQLSHWHPTGGA